MYLKISAALIAGFVAGALLSVAAFAIRVDVLGIPYNNRPVVAQSDLTAVQGDFRILVPAGAVLLHRYNAAQQSFYSLELVSGPHDAPTLSPAGTRSVFFKLEKPSQ